MTAIVSETDRCAWAGSDPLYQRYHDIEWGRPVTDDRDLFEKLCLEGFQSGLSWITILRKRENFRAAFQDFEIGSVAAMNEADVERLLLDAGIVRHRGKIASTINNARRTLAIQRAVGSLAKFVWNFEPEPLPPELPATPLPSQTEASRALSKALRAQGFTFVGPTTCYAFMQAMGLVNDHAAHCFCRAEVELLRTGLQRP